MALGIDFGTTHTTVAVVEQGNYPVISFSDTEGNWIDNYPSALAVKGDEIKFGFEAVKIKEDPEWTFIRSIKSLLKNHQYTSFIQIHDYQYEINPLVEGFLKELKRMLIEESNYDFSDDQPLEVSIAVPALTNNIQRFLTAENFRQAGFSVINMINEPSAVTMEYTRSYYKKPDASRKKYLLVYDLGGGTFDASIAEIHDNNHRIFATEGNDHLGGDQFDEVLAGMIKEEFLKGHDLSYGDEIRLLENCRMAKESLNAQSKNIYLDWVDSKGESHHFKFAVNRYYERCQPLIDQTFDILDNLTGKIPSYEDFDQVTNVYLVGGMSNFPIINRVLKEKYGNSRVRKSKHCESAVAIGLATLMDKEVDYSLEESLTRYFGFWNEADSGKDLIFEPVFEKDQPLPNKEQEPVRHHRRYTPSHNLGIFRFQECSQLKEGKPEGLITVWNQIYFPFDPAIQETDLSSINVQRYDSPTDYQIEEIYTLDYKGDITVELINHQSGYTKQFNLSRMSTKK